MNKKVIIVDDNTEVTRVLLTKLAAHADITVIGTATDGTTGLQMVLRERPDLLFLDVELPDLDGLQFMQRMQEADFWCPVVIFTAHEKYMLPAFRSKAFDFLQKPIDDAELRGILTRVQQEEPLPPTSPKGADDSVLLYLNSVDFLLTRIRDIGFCQYNHDLRLWEVVVADMPKPIRLKRNVTSAQLLALDGCMMQVSQKYIINTSCLMKVQDNCCRFYPPFDHIDYVKVGRLFRRKLIERFKTL